MTRRAILARLLPAVALLFLTGCSASQIGQIMANAATNVTLRSPAYAAMQEFRAQPNPLTGYYSVVYEFPGGERVNTYVVTLDNKNVPLIEHSDEGPLAERFTLFQMGYDIEDVDAFMTNAFGSTSPMEVPDSVSQILDPKTAPGVGGMLYVEGEAEERPDGSRAWTAYFMLGASEDASGRDAEFGALVKKYLGPKTQVVEAEVVEQPNGYLEGSTLLRSGDREAVRVSFRRLDKEGFHIDPSQNVAR